MNCKDEELKAKLYSNRATAHFNLGEDFKVFDSFVKLTVFQEKIGVFHHAFINNVSFISLISVQVTSMVHSVMQRRPRTYNLLISKPLFQVRVTKGNGDLL